MTTVPPETPVTTPDDTPTEAKDGTLEVHVPPEVPDDESVIVAPGQTLAGPEIVPAEGVAVTVIVVDAVSAPQLLVTI